ncbi:CoA-transferase family III [Amylocystis lapponica]|nr:CoA-transferase family III [Amylocystis lapponica]
MAELAIAEALWTAMKLSPQALSRLVLSKTPDPAVNSSFKLGTAAQTSIGLSGLAAAEFHRLRTGVKQTVTVDARHAVLEFKSEAWYTINGELPEDRLFDNIAGLYKTKDGSYVRLHTNFPHHRQGILDILQCEPTKAAVASALLQWNAVDLETVASARKMVATALRSFDQWDQHPQAKALASTPPVVLVKIADAPKREVHDMPSRPLDGIRVLDLTRVLAGPVCGRTLAAHGADVLLVTSPKLPDLPFLDVDTSRGKRTAQLDLTTSEDSERLAALVQDADVFLQAYRPGGLREKRFGPEDVAKARPGIVYASLTAYGWDGPWKNRRGFDSLVQTATGLNFAEAEAYAGYTGSLPSEPLTPRPFPVQALDHAAGYLLAFGINAALCKTVTEGGSWEVRVSLAAVGQWIRSLGRLDPRVAFGGGRPMPVRAMPLDPEISPLTVEIRQSVEGNESAEPRKKMTAIGHAALLSKTPVREREASICLQSHSAMWAPRM